MAPTQPARAGAETEKSYTESASSAADEDDGPRGRKLERDASDGDKGESGDEAKGTGQRKRKRSRKGLDKKYMCPHEDCGKSYSRAEHLYRHQLNHNPKQIYKCDFPDCPRWFVRQDLCARHRERHTTRGSHLQRKESNAAMSEPNSAVDGRAPQLSASSPAHRTELSINTGPYGSGGFDLHGSHMQSPATDLTMGVPRGPMSASYAETFHSQPYPPGNGNNSYGTTASLHRSNSDTHFYDPNLLAHASGAAYGTAYGATGQSSLPQYGYAQGMQNGQNAATLGGDQTQSRSFKRRSSQLNNEFANYASLTGASANFASQNMSTDTQSLGQQTYGTPAFIGGTMASMGGISAQDTRMADVSTSVFDMEDYARSPTVMTGDFTTWLFNDPGSAGSKGQQENPLLDPSLRSDSNGSLPAPMQDPMAVASILGSSAPGSVISEKKRQSLLELIQARFNETGNSAVKNQKNHVFQGDINQEGHVLSLRSIQTYIGSYWYHFHDQMPILHRPTFSADNSQNLLLIAVIAIGAANLDKMHGQEKTSASAELANFLAWHLRGELFMDKDFPPPTKLWVLQALLLLEAYEKVYSSRVLHERSQIHHATTVSLLRRGSALLGRSALDSPPNEEETSSSAIADTPDPWWNHWITTEATKRVAFAAFIMDSTHATMFSHTAVMVAHEMRLRLPCDEALWSATSGVEVSRLRDKYGDPVPFLDGLKSTLNARAIRTNSFGRAALMAGLMNVSFHLGQRDLQVRSLGVELGGKDRWRGNLTKAFDIWERDWDNNTPEQSKSQEPKAFSQTSWQGSGNKEEEQLFESRVVLHHLAHMGMHVDIVQCQIFAGANRLLGRTITQPDRSNAERRMRENWAPKASARDAVFYSLRFISQVLAPYLNRNTDGRQSPSQGYSPRDDYLLNRPWVLYFAALVVWSYGFALDGPLSTPVSDSLLTDHTAQLEDMRAFMGRVGAVQKPDDLAHVTGRNCVVGLLGILITSFRRARWELMREGAHRLRDCVNKLTGRNDKDEDP